MGNVPHYPWYPDDYLSSPWVMTCSLAEEGIYRRLLDYQWKSPGCQLPDDISYLRKLLKKGATDKLIMGVLQANFTQLTLNGDTTVWRNERLYVEFCRALHKSHSAREAVKLRKNRPLKQSDDSRAIEQKHQPSSIVRQSFDSPPEVEVEVKVVPEVELLLGESKKKRFKEPSVEEVEQYCRERNNGISGQTFVAHYAAKGWMLGKNKMVSWKQAVITWEEKRKNEGPQNGGGRGQGVGSQSFHQ